jgi:hypothetical protein
MLERLRAALRRPKAAEDVAPDTAVARSRETGGRDTDEVDSPTTTGTGRNEEFVGRVSGDEASGGEESGAEARKRDS